MCGDMEKLEKVIKALENCNAPEKCRDCPWKPCEEPDCKHSDYLDGLIEQAIALLKAQEPRVMTLEEVVSAAGTPAWFEGRSKRTYTGWVLVYDVQAGMGITGIRVGVTKPGHITIWPATELYGAKWRCWTSRPTDEQREAVPWNAQK